eukprot:12680536-Ditylum_brightwellii.AAC.1
MSVGYIPPAMVILYKDKNDNGKQDNNEPVLSDAVVKIRGIDCTADNKGQIVLPLATEESIDVTVPNVVSDMKDLMLLSQSTGPGK